MKLNTDRLNAFYQVALDKNFCKAADSLCITQSALSQRVLKIEQEVGTKLLVRSNDGISLTEHGKILFDYVTDQQSKEHDLLNRISGRSTLTSGIIKIGAFSSVMRSVIMPSLLSLIQSADKLKAEFYSRELRELQPLLDSGEVDFIITDKAIRDPAIESIHLGVETLVHIRNRNPILMSKIPCFLDHDAEDTTTYDFFEAQGYANFEFDRSFYDDVYGLLDGVILGFGEAVVSRHMVKENEFIEIIPHAVKVESDVVLSYAKNRYLSKLHQKLINNLKENVPTYLSRK